MVDDISVRIFRDELNREWELRAVREPLAERRARLRRERRAAHTLVRRCGTSIAARRTRVGQRGNPAAALDVTSRPVNGARGAIRHNLCPHPEHVAQDFSSSRRNDMDGVEEGVKASAAESATAA